jgi:hypothetical protein
MREKVEVKLEKAKLREEKEIIGSLNSLVKEWFFSKFKAFSESQLYGVLPVYERKNILIENVMMNI